MKKENLIYSTLILTIASIFTRIIGMVFRVYLSNQIGAVGMGLYQMIISYIPSGKVISDDIIAGYISNNLIYESKKLEEEN